MKDRLRDEAERLSEAAERLADVAMELLSAGVNGDETSVAIEREVQRARRSVAKASEILRAVSDQPSD